MLISGHVTLGNDSCNLCRNKIARQVARKIAKCNSAFSVKHTACHAFGAVTKHKRLEPITDWNKNIQPEPSAAKKTKKRRHNPSPGWYDFASILAENSNMLNLLIGLARC